MKISIITQLLQKHDILFPLLSKKSLIQTSFPRFGGDSRKNALLNILWQYKNKHKDEDEELTNDELMSLINLIEPSYTSFAKTLKAETIKPNSYEALVFEIAEEIGCDFLSIVQDIKLNDCLFNSLQGKINSLRELHNRLYNSLKYTADYLSRYVTRKEQEFFKVDTSFTALNNVTSETLVNLKRSLSLAETDKAAMKSIVDTTSAPCEASATTPTCSLCDGKKEFTKFTKDTAESLIKTDTTVSPNIEGFHTITTKRIFVDKEKRTAAEKNCQELNKLIAEEKKNLRAVNQPEFQKLSLKRTALSELMGNVVTFKNIYAEFLKVPDSSFMLRDHLHYFNCIAKMHESLAVLVPQISTSDANATKYITNHLTEASLFKQLTFERDQLRPTIELRLASEALRSGNSIVTEPSRTNTASNPSIANEAPKTIETSAPVNN